MSRLAALMMAAIPFVAMGSVVEAAEVTPDPLAADVQLVHVGNSGKAADDGDYRYGEKLDIQKVLSIESNPGACGITPAVMTYQDSRGKTHTVHYDIMGSGCQNG